LNDQIAVNRPAQEQQPKDAELVRRAQRGAPTAFAELVSRYQDRVFNTCYRMCQNHADALDLTQSTFLRALEGLGQFRGRASFYTWLFRIAVNLTRSHRRSEARRATRPLDGPSGDGHRSDPGAAGRDCPVSGPAEQRELQERVEWALGQLDDEYRAAVVLKDIEDLDYASIAEILEVPVGTVKSRIHRGRLVLRKLLRDERAPVDQAPAR
jgi:RNA polymerase sigma-70 factor (ECF subfamily)